jgi:hypothetical protein
MDMPTLVPPKISILSFEAIGGRTSYLITAADEWDDLATNYTELTGQTDFSATLGTWGTLLPVWVITPKNKLKWSWISITKMISLWMPSFLMFTGLAKT